MGLVAKQGHLMKQKAKASKRELQKDLKREKKGKPPKQRTSSKGWVRRFFVLQGSVVQVGYTTVLGCRWAILQY
jgi:hypothetical protein